jgi:hypothetical protein
MDLLFLRSGSTGRQGFRVTHNRYWPGSIADASRYSEASIGDSCRSAKTSDGPQGCTAAPLGPPLFEICDLPPLRVTTARFRLSAVTVCRRDVAMAGV